MRRTGLGFAVGLGVCLIAAGALAGGTPDTGAGAKQMVFRFSGLSNLGLSSYGGGLGLRYFFGEGLAVRPGIDFGYRKDTNDAPGSGYADGEETETELGFSVVLEKYMPPVSSVAPYVGVGLGYYRSTEEDKPIQPDDEEEAWKVTSSAFEVLGVAGFQWYFTDAMSLGGEYTASFYMGSEKTEYTTPGGQTDTADEQDTTEFSWYAASVYLSIHVR